MIFSALRWIIRNRRFQINYAKFNMSEITQPKNQFKNSVQLPYLEIAIKRPKYKINMGVPSS